MTYSLHEGYIDPMTDSIAYHRAVPVVDRTEVLVGGGPAGIAAAIASARHGALV